ncbi:hypothetical protein C1645_754305 [Glomus cerebriforme]|uniref:RNase H type-1 domain-containing protein n=1 Tax=Glomus cerebriforme TaxID=658196 RepID=A0A397TIF7_9GLOM|nr:hypothetical protein C1645_754305 [Glomus cerebriforme]
MRPLKRVFKHRLKLPSTTPDNTIHNDIFPSINDLQALQITSHLPIYNYILNCPHLTHIARQLIINSQLDLWLPWWPTLQQLTSINQKNYLPFTTFTKGLIRFAQMGFTFTPTFDTVIRGGTKPIVEAIPFDRHTLKSWKNRLIMFEDQLINPDGIYVKEWKDINVNPYDRSEKIPGRQHSWYQRYIDIKTIGLNKNLITPISINRCHLPSHIPPKISSSYHHYPKNEWSSHWHAPSSQTLFGKTIEQRNDPFSFSMTYIEHWINNPPPSFTRFGTPKKYPPILTTCTGCSLHTPYYRDLRPKCVIMAPTLHLHRIYTRHKDYIHSHIPNIPYKKFVILTSPIQSLKVLTYNFYIHSTGLPSQVLLSRTSLTNDLVNNPHPNAASSFISKMLVGDVNTITRLSIISSSFMNRSEFTFFTDGSVLDIGTKSCKSGLGWLETSNTNNITSFCAKISHHASSTRAEIMAIFTALLTTPPNSQINIHTDSQCSISSFNRIMNPLTSLRWLHKIPNFLIWQAVKHTITSNNLTVHLHKVKAHSNNLFNDAADALAKEGSLLTSAIHLNFKNLPDNSAILTWNNIGPLERPARKWATDLFAAKAFNNLINSPNISSLLHKCVSINIDFNLTKHWLNYNPFPIATSSELSSYISYKIKSSISLLPTCDLLQRNLPSIYLKSPIPCPSCNSTLDSNDHILLCPAYSFHLINVITTHESILPQFLFDKQPIPNNIPLNTIKQWVSALPFFHNIHTSPLQDNLELILISHQYIPLSFDDHFKKKFSKKKHRLSHLLDFLHFLLSDIHKVTWLAHCDARIEWEKTLNITQKSKRSSAKRKSRDGVVSPRTGRPYLLIHLH